MTRSDEVRSNYLPQDDRLTPDLLRLAALIMLGTLAVQLDVTMVNVAIHAFQESFGASVSTIQWVSAGYALALSMMIPLTGWVIDRFGAKRMWLLSIALFLAGSVLCGAAWSVESLIAFRVLQGLGGGLLLPIGQAILMREAGERRRGRLMAAIGVPALLGPVAGPVVGGLIVDDLGWRWIFFVNVPVCALGFALSAWIMPDHRPAGGDRLDLLGLALISPGLAATVYGLSRAGDSGGFGSPWVLLPLAGGVALLVAFGVHALRAPTPLIDVRLFRSRAFAASSAVVFLVGIASLGSMLLLPLYFQQVRGEDPLHAGLLVAPQGVGLGVALVVAGTLADRRSPCPIVLTGVLLTVLGTLAYATVGPDTSVLMLAGALVLSGAGLGAALIPVMAAALRGLRDEAIPRATSAVRIFQQLGGSFGAAVLAVVLQRQLVERVAAAPGGQPTPAALAGAYGHAFWWALGFAALAAVPALFLPSTPPSVNDPTH